MRGFVLRRSFRKHKGQGVRYLCAFFLWGPVWKFRGPVGAVEDGRAEGGLFCALEDWPGGIGRIVPCQVVGNHRRLLKKVGYNVVTGLLADPRKLLAWTFQNLYLVSFGTRRIRLEIS